jgi:hypothetical protein
MKAINPAIKRGMVNFKAPFPPDFLQGCDKKRHARHRKNSMGKNIFRIVSAFKNYRILSISEN